MPEAWTHPTAPSCIRDRDLLWVCQDLSDQVQLIARGHLFPIFNDNQKLIFGLKVAIWLAGFLCC